jgi:tetratricopeptide (TPR) repeat protein
MKARLTVLFLFTVICGFAQNTNDLRSHYEAYYQAMKSQGDVTGVISALTHLNVIAPSRERIDTLAYVYANNNQHMQALNTIGIEKNESDSDLAVQVKAISLKAINQPKRAVEQFEILNQRSPNAYLAYELADLKIQTGDNEGAMTDITAGLSEVEEDMTYAFYERQQPYEVSLKAALMHLKGLVQYNMDHNNIDTAIATINEALALEPNFNLASLSKQALVSRKGEGEKKEK